MARDQTLIQANADLLRRQRQQRTGDPSPVVENLPKLPVAVSRFSRSTLPLKTQELLAAANLPLRHERRINSEEHPRWIKTRDMILDKVGSGFSIALLGKRGTGKTQLGVHVLIAGCAIGRTARYAKAMDFFLAVRATYKAEGKSELDAVNEFVEPSTLVLDELQVRGETEFEDRMLTYMMDKRYDAMKDTILIANLMPDELEASMGPSIADRMSESGGVVVCDWESFRVTK